MNADLTLYLNSITVNSIKIELLINALGIHPHIKSIALEKGEHRSASFLKLNPHGKVPVLVESNLRLTESNAILQYLAASHNALWPASQKQQAETLMWLFWLSNGWGASLGSLVHHRVVMPYWGFKSSSEKAEENLERFHQQANYLNHALEDKRALVGREDTIADIGLGSYLIFAKEANIPLEKYPNIVAWLQHLQAKSWWQKTKQNLDTRLLEARPYCGY